MREPRQARSADSLRRIANSTRRTLETKSFEDATLKELVSGAGVTTGAFYARFEGKAALLDLLELEAYEDFRGHLFAAAREQPPTLTAEEGIRRYLTATAYLYREHRGVVRSIIIASRSDPDRNRRRMRFTGEMIDRGVATILELAGQIRHPDPSRAVKMALLFTTSALRDVLLFDEDWLARSGEELADAELVDELTVAALAYLERADA